MSTRVLILVAVIWAAIGVVVAFLMRRRGHDFFVWLVLGVALGPLAVPLAVGRARFFRSAEHQSRGAPTPPHAGFDLLAAVDGTDESIRAIDAALTLFGGTISSLTIATVLNYDSEGTVTGAEDQEAAREMLESVAAKIEHDPVDTIVLFGPADKALAEFARRSGIELIIVGARGHGASEAFFGSVTAKLVGESEIPVFVGPVVSAASDADATIPEATGTTS